MKETTKLQRLIGSANAVIDKKGTVRTNGKVASLRTVQLTREVMSSTCRRLHKLGFYLEDIHGLSAKHIEALASDWFFNELSPKSMQNLLSRLRVFSVWINKRGIVREGGMSAYWLTPDPTVLKVKTCTEKSKSWAGNAIDTLQVIERALEEDHRLYVMLLMGVFFGLRAKEMLHLKPHQADQGDVLEVKGHVAKGGRYRLVRIYDGDIEIKGLGRIQREVLNLAKTVCARGETLGWPGRTYEQNRKKYYYYLEKLGITKKGLGVVGHGLRAEFAENQLILRGLVPPVFGGTGKEMSVTKRRSALHAVASGLGHNDTHTSGAYFGSFSRGPTQSLKGADFSAVPAKDMLEARIGKLCSYTVKLA
jgi:integrase